MQKQEARLSTQDMDPLDNTTLPAQLRVRDRRRMVRRRVIVFVQQDRRQPPERRGGLDRRSIYQPPQTLLYLSTPESATPPIPPWKSR